MTDYHTKLNAMQQALPTRQLVLKHLGDGRWSMQIFLIIFRVLVIIGMMIGCLGNLFELWQLSHASSPIRPFLVAIGLLFASTIILMGLINDIKNFMPKQRIKLTFNNPTHQPWQFVVLSVNSVGDSLYFTTVINGIMQEINVNGHEKTPMFLNKQQGKVVGLKANHCQTIIPLWESLSNINFSKAEKQAILQAYHHIN